MSARPQPRSPARRPLTGVAETARWVATYRAWESARPDALFHDPFAARLAGARGEEIARAMPQPGAGGNGWPIVTRTVLIDAAVEAAVAEGCTAVLNLGAGYDTRPYRLALPADLAWIEVDQPALLDEKTRILEGEVPRCALERVPANLADDRAREALLDEVAARHGRVLVLTEGVLVYLDAEAVAGLAQALAARPGVTDWITDSRVALDGAAPAPGPGARPRRGPAEVRARRRRRLLRGPRLAPARGAILPPRGGAPEAGALAAASLRLGAAAGSPRPGPGPVGGGGAPGAGAVSTDRARERDLKRAYRLEARPAGAFRVSCPAAGRTLLGTTRNLEGAVNRHRFMLAHGLHPDPAMQRAFDEHGEAAFVIEVLEAVTPKDDPVFDLDAELDVLEEVWLEALAGAGEVVVLPRR